MKNRKDLFYILVYFFITLAFFKVPYMLIELNDINEVYFGAQLIIFCLFALFSLKEIKYNWYILLIIIFLIFNSIVSIGKTEVTTILSSFINVAGLCLVVNYGSRKNASHFFKGFKFAFSFLLLVNLITMIKYPDGLYYNPGNNSSQNWFLGYKNAIIMYIYPLIIFSHIDTIVFKKRKISKFDLFAFIISVASIVMSNSSTSIVGLTVIIAVIVLPNLIKNTTLLNSINYFYAYIGLFFAIIVFKMQNIFSFIIEDVLHKDLTFTGRTFIWEYVLKNIKNIPLFGYGDKSFVYTLASGTTVRSTHNQILQIIYNYGVISVTLFILILFITMKKLYKIREFQLVKFVSLYIFMWFIMMLIESYDMQYFMYLVVLAYNTNYIINIKGNGVNE